MLWFQLAGLAIGYPLLALAFGWVVLGRWCILDRQERFAAALGVGLAGFAACQFIAFLTRAPQPLFSEAAAGAIATATALGWLIRPAVAEGAQPESVAELAGLWVLGCLHLLCIQALLPDYVGSNWWGDWYHHFLAVRVFLGELPTDTQWGGAGMYTVASRTPLFNLATAWALNLAGTHFWAYQVASVAPSCAFATAVYLLLRDLFNPRTARLGLLLAPLNLWMVHLGWFTWPKLLAGYFMLLGLHFYLQALRRRRTKPKAAQDYFFCFWVASLLSYLTHPVAAVYLGVLLLHAAVLWLRERAARPDLRRLALLGLTALLLLGPWYGWLLTEFGLSRSAGNSPVAQMTGEAIDLRYLLISVGSNLWASVVPGTLLHALGARPIDWEEVYRGLTELYFSLLTGALTISLCLFLLVRLLWGLRHGWLRSGWAALLTAEKTAMLAFVGLATLGAAFLHPLRVDHGIGHAALFCSVVMLVALGWGVLGGARPAVAAAVCFGMVAEFLAMFWSHIWLVDTPLKLDPFNFNVAARNEGGVVFLIDVLGVGKGPAATATGLVELALCVALGWWVMGVPRPAPQKKRSEVG